MSFFKKLFGKSEHAPLSKRALLERLAQRIQELHGIKQTRINVAEECVEWLSDNDLSGTAFIDNLWVEYQSQPTALDDLIQSHLDVISSIITAEAVPLDERKLSFFPLIKPRAWLDGYAEQLKAIGTLSEQEIKDQVAHHVLNDELIVTYVEDKPSQLSFLSVSESQELGGIEALHALCRENFMAQKLPDVQVEGANGRYALRLDGFFDATLILFLAEFLPQMALTGQPLIAIPSREELLICGDGADEDIWTLQGMAEEINAQTAYPISSYLFRRQENGHWETARFQRYEKDGQRLLSEVRTQIH